MTEPVYYLKIMRSDLKSPMIHVKLQQRKWLPPVEPVLCHSGYHFCRDWNDLATWLVQAWGTELWVIKVRGKRASLIPDAKPQYKDAAEQMILVRKLDIPLDVNPDIQWQKRYNYWGYRGDIKRSGFYLRTTNTDPDQPWKHSNYTFVDNRDRPDWYTLVNLAVKTRTPINYPRRTNLYKYLQPILAAQGLEKWGEN